MALPEYTGSKGDAARELERRFRICPFNQNHLIEIGSFQKHLIKCKKAYPSSKLIMCPFDASEYISPENMAEHQKSCKRRNLLIPVDDVTTECRNLRQKPVDVCIRTCNEEEWVSDEEYESRDFKTAVETSRKLEENNRQMQPFYENAYGPVNGVGRGSYFSSLNSSPSSRFVKQSSALDPIVTRTPVRKSPSIEENKEHEDEDDTSQYDDDDDDDDESVIDPESFRKFYTDVKLGKTTQHNDNAEQLQREQQRKSLNSSTHSIYSKEEISRKNESLWMKSIGRGLNPHLREDKTVYSRESKLALSQTQKTEDVSPTDICSQLEQIQFQPSKFSQMCNSRENRDITPYSSSSPHSECSESAESGDTVVPRRNGIQEYLAKKNRLMFEKAERQPNF